jgi:dihydrofolate synthase / folylpolyglutamate synthase
MTRATVTRPKTRARKVTASTGVKTFRSAVNFLGSLTNYERVPGFQYIPANFGLARMNRILSALGNPHKAYRTVHIAGTKGKGSTAAMLMEMLRAGDHKVGLYTSPHVLDVRERIMVNGRKISEAEFAKGVAAVAKVIKKAKVANPTYFEVMTASAFRYFAEQGVDLAVIEVGMGGRLDSTNVIHPEVVGITSISLDHMAQLGHNLESIAREKAGVIKKGVPVISAPQPEKVRKVLIEAAEAAGSPIRFTDENTEYSYRFEFSRAVGRHARICFTTPNSRYEHVHVPLPGEHQAINCGLALGMLDVLKEKGFTVDDEKAILGLANVDLPARMQVISENPRILVDGAHNAASIDALMRAIGQNVTYDSMVVIFGCHKDKDISGMIRRLQVGADKVIFTSTGSPRSADPAELAASYIENSGKMAQVAPTLDDAVRIALRAVGRDDLICVTGSFYLAADAIKKYSKSAS